MIRRLGTAALLAVLLSTGSAPARPALAADPWSAVPSSGRVAASFAPGTSGPQATLVLENRTSITDDLKLGPTETFLLNALGLSGTYSQTATWPPGAAPAISCPASLFGPSTTCLRLPNGAGAALIPGRVRAPLIADAPAARGQTLLVVGPNAGSAAYDVALVAVGGVLDVLKKKAPLVGVPLDLVVDVALTIRPEADIVVAALLRGDVLGAGANFRGLMDRALDVLKEKITAFAVDLLLIAAASGPGAVAALAIDFAIVVGKAVLPLMRLVQASQGDPHSTVTIGYAPIPVLGGTWSSPADGAKLTSATVILSAKPTATVANVKITKVTFYVAWATNSPKAACSATSPGSNGAWSCKVNLWNVGAPLGALSLSFDVFDDAGDLARSPDGARTVTLAAPPPAPTKVTAVTTDPEGMYSCDAVSCYWPFRVTWQDNAQNETGYVVYATPLGPDGNCGFVLDGPRVVVARLPANSTSWDTEIREGQAWFELWGLRYAVAATNAAGTSSVTSANDLVMWANCNFTP